MRIVTLIFFLCSGTISYSQIPFDYQRDFKSLVEVSKDKTSDLYYPKLLERFRNNDSTLNRRETLILMIGYTTQPHYRPYEDMETEQEIFQLNDEGDYETALEKSKRYLETHPVSLRVLKERSFSYHQTGKRDSAQFFMDLVDKVMSAMIYSGKGRDPEAPIFSLGLADGEQFIPNIGMTIAHKKTGFNKSKNFMEIINAMTEEGVYLNYFFVIQHAKEKMDGIDHESAPVKKGKKGKKKSKEITEPVQEDVKKE
jgi:hypothetical protein